MKLLFLFITLAVAGIPPALAKYFTACKGGDLTNCAALTRDAKSWRIYREAVSKILHSFCAKKEPEFACLSIGGLAREGLIDREAARKFLEEKCARKNGEACFGRYSMELEPEPPHGFRAKPGAETWLGRGCEAGHVSSCETKKRFEKNPDARLRGD